MILSQYLPTKISPILNDNKKLLLIAAVVLITLLGYMWYHHARYDTVVMQPTAVTNPAMVAKSLDVSFPVASDIVTGIQRATAKPAEMSWTVPASTPQVAAKIVEKQIEYNKAPPLPPADKTIVTPQETKVDLYRITLDKPWEVGIGYGNHNGDSYIPIEVQRNYLKNMAISAEVHMDMACKKSKVTK